MSDNERPGAAANPAAPFAPTDATVDLGTRATRAGTTSATTDSNTFVPVYAARLVAGTSNAASVIIGAGVIIAGYIGERELVFYGVAAADEPLDTLLSRVLGNIVPDTDVRPKARGTSPDAPPPAMVMNDDRGWGVYFTADGERALLGRDEGQPVHRIHPSTLKTVEYSDADGLLRVIQTPNEDTGAGCASPTAGEDRH